jgi:hypothetical protein
MADFNESVMSKEFVLNAAKRKARELESLEKARRNKVSLTEPAMERWIKANPKSRAAKLALDADGNVDLSKISDAEKIQFTKNLNLGNIDFFNKPEGPKGVPIFDKDGLVGFENTKKFEEDMGGQQIRMNPDQPNRAQIRERRNNAMLDDIRSEIKETGKHPFGEGPILGTDHAREVELSKKYGGDMAGLKKAARDVRDNPFNKVNYAEAFMPADFNQPKPLPPTSSPVSSFEPSQKMVSQDMLDRNNQEVNSVLDSVPFPRPKSPQAPKPKPRNPITTLPFSLEQPVSKEPGVELTRTSKEYPTMDVPKYPANSEPSVDLTRTTKEYPTMDAPTAQHRKQSSSFGRSGKKQYNIPALDRLDLDNYDYRPNAPKHPGGAGFGRSGKKQYNIPALDFLDLDNYFYNQ